MLNGYIFQKNGNGGDNMSKVRARHNNLLVGADFS